MQNQANLELYEGWHCCVRYNKCISSPSSFLIWGYTFFAITIKSLTWSGVQKKKKKLFSCMFYWTEKTVKGSWVILCQGASSSNSSHNKELNRSHITNKPVSCLNGQLLHSAPCNKLTAALRISEQLRAPRCILKQPWDTTVVLCFRKAQCTGSAWFGFSSHTEQRSVPILSGKAQINTFTVKICGENSTLIYNFDYGWLGFIYLGTLWLKKKVGLHNISKSTSLYQSV